MAKNIYRYTNLKDESLKLSSIQEYEEAEKKVSQLDKEIGEITVKERIPFYHLRTQEFSRLIAAPSPDVLVAICPYCARKIWARIKHGVFTLNASFWVMEYDDGKTVTDDSKCEHLFVMDGALNLNNQPIPEKISAFSFIRHKIYMGAEVPFIKPRILDKEGVIAVIHSVSIAEKYIGFPVTYFSKNFISQSEFATGWAREEYVARDQIVSSATFVGERREPQEYDLEKWIEQKKVLWLVEDKDDLLLNKETDLYPYHQIAGRRNPFLLQDGKVIEIPNVEEVITKTTLETFMPGQ
jgi:hypothetical protein